MLAKYEGFTDMAKFIFDVREYSENAFRSMEIQICEETRTVQFTCTDNGGDHPTSPSVAIPWADAIGVAHWILKTTGTFRIEKNVMVGK